MTSNSMRKRSVDPRSHEEQEASRREFASNHGLELDEVCRIEEGLRRIPIERFLEGCFGKNHGAFYDPHEDLWIVPDRSYRGCGFAFVAIRSDRSWFSGVVPMEVFQ